MVRMFLFQWRTAMTRIGKSWLARVECLWRGSSRFPITRQRKATFRPQLEVLEDRLAPATITVTVAGDTLVNGQVTLREAIQSINQGADLNGDVTANRVGAYGTNDAINFNIGNAAQQINLKTASLPAL